MQRYHCNKKSCAACCCSSCLYIYIYSTPEKAGKAIGRALPNSRFGSATDSYGFKRCKSATSNFKKVLTEQVNSVASAPVAELASYLQGALAIVENTVEFNDPANNAWRCLCFKKLHALVDKTLKSKSLESDTRAKLQALVDARATAGADEESPGLIQEALPALVDSRSSSGADEEPLGLIQEELQV